eukprot:COSAG01_NODE_4287_length_5173_cov_12.473000_3_plen_30_part_00
MQQEVRTLSRVVEWAQRIRILVLRCVLEI